MSKYIWPINGLNLLLLLIFINHSISTKEGLLQNGQLVLLELAPVDPRSLMQGDYMQLNYAIASNNINEETLNKRGFIIVQIDEQNVAQRVRIQPSVTPILSGESVINYTLGQYGGINIGAESFFFEEGQASKFDKAKYGGIRIDIEGHSLLEGLYDKDKKKIN
jgi:uncharacterized membrane-anchored protein